MNGITNDLSRRTKLIWVKVFILALAIPFFHARSDAGAITPFITYEAEEGTLEGGATIRVMTTLPSAPTVELESSGRACVDLNATGESVSWTTTEDCNAIVVRASIPDAPNGGGITATLSLYVDGVFRQTIALTSEYSWIYGVRGFTDNNPSTGTPKRFYDMQRAFISGAEVPSGSTIMLKKDASDTASYYRIDLIQLENVGAPLPQPANTLSITAYGATPDDETDDSNAIKNCISACQSQKKGMWMPSGTFRSQGIINATGINIYGAGMWHTTNHRIIGDRHKWNLTDCTIQDLFIKNHEIARTMADGHDYGMTIQGANGWLVQRVWVHRGGASFWCSGTDGTVRDCRATESWADGYNFNNGTTSDKEGIRLTCTNNYTIGSADDGIAINSQNGEGAAGNMVDTKIVNNTSIAVNWANGIRIAGGRNSLIQHNLITDPTDGSGIRVGQFGTDGNPCESVLVTENLILRGCGIRPTYGHGGIAVTDTATATIESNIILDSPGIGIDVQDCTATFTGNLISNPFEQGFSIKSGAAGTGIFTGNTVEDLNNGQLAFQNNAPATFSATVTGNSWQGIPVDGVTVDPIAALLPVTGTKQLTATVTPTNALNQTINWSSSDPAIAMVDANGLVAALSGGTATITATTQQGLFTATSEVTVVSANEEVGTFQAEDANYNGPTPAINNAGYHGTGFLDYQNSFDDYITWIFDAPADGPYELSVRYAVASGDRPLSLSINGTEVIASWNFPATGAWTNWATVTTSQTLQEGVNTVTLTAIGSSGGNIDELIVVNLRSDYIAWSAQYAGSDLSDPNADFDDDGVSNEQERIWGLNPTDDLSRAPLTNATGLSTGTFQYTRRTPAFTGYDYTLWISTDLQTWSQDTGAIQTPGAPVNEVESVTVHLSPALLTHSNLFVRVQATK